jgi:hypothetical protein
VNAWVALTEAQRKKSDADVATARSALDLEMAQRKLADGVKAGTIPLDEARNMLDRWVQAGTITRAEADSVAGKFLNVAVQANGIPKNVNTVVTADTTRAEQRLNEILARYKNGGLTVGSVVQMSHAAGGGFFKARSGAGLTWKP